MAIQPLTSTLPRSLGAGVWRLADPKISLASMASMLLGACAAAAAGPLDWGWLALTVLGVFAVEVAKNASGEVFDFDSGTDLAVAAQDRSPFSGGKRVMVDGLLSRGETIGVAALAYVAGIAAGIAIVAWREPGVLWLGVAGLALAFFYHAPPLALSYRGLGELAVAVCYGPLIAAGTFWVQRGELAAEVLWAAAPLGLAIAAFLWINEFPDYRADLAAGKRTLVVRLGRPRAARAFAVLLAAVFALVAVLPLLGLPWTVWLGFVALVPAAQAVLILLAHPETPGRIVPAQSRTLLAFVLLALGMGLGILISGSAGG